MRYFGRNLVFAIITVAMILSTTGCSNVNAVGAIDKSGSHTGLGAGRTSGNAADGVNNASAGISGSAGKTSTGAANQPKPNFSVHVPILMYHDITYLKNNSLGMSPASFAAQMKYLHDNGFHTITFNQLYAAFYEGAALPSKPILLTFDDGYETVYTNAYPVMKRYGQVGTVFMVTGVVGKRTGYPELTWDELTQMEASGVMDIESHTIHHVDLAIVPSSVAQAELQKSATTLELHLGHPIRYFCYPSSRYTATTIRQLQQIGYRLAVTEHPGVASLANGPYELKRLRVSEGISLQGFSLLVNRTV